jgi:predicted hotdog family 3-hydroxylacyl-ACP dehydratase
MAVHAGLTAATGRRPRAGYLASVRDVVRSVGRLDLLADDLEVTATLLGSGPAGALYGFALRGGDATLLSGRAAVVIDADATGSPA